MTSPAQLWQPPANTEQAAFLKVQKIYQKYVASRPRWFELQQATKIKKAADYRAATTTGFGAQTVREFFAAIELQRAVGKQKHDRIEAKVRSLAKQLAVTSIVVLLLALTQTILLSENIPTPVVKSVNKIVCSSREISTTIDLQERRISQQAAAVNQTTTTMLELGRSSRQMRQTRLGK